ncbi:MAG TPA: aminotransferase class III-fold pyridoxal phosphate-dependent enzyme, partial [Rhizomicrobium sp.]|nr:aminotransferase class III-fold pyridoxal phosphate-dependent enzyme [Rhizomicrobium sp.]
MSTREHNLTKHWQAIDAAHHIHPFTDTAALNKEGVRVITRADGVYLWDSNGEKILDGMSGLWCVQVGYGNRELADAGYEALKTLPYYNHFFKTTNPYTAELADKMAKLLPEGHERVLFASSGSEANDSALKLIRYYWNLKKKPHKKIHLSRELAYHGVTMAAASLSGLTPMHPQFDLPLPGFEKVPTPYWYGSKAAYGDITPEELGRKVAEQLEKKILELGADNVASFSAEPVHGAGGVIFPPPGYWDEINRICKKHDVLLHTDEVITGFGRT